MTTKRRRSAMTGRFLKLTVKTRRVSSTPVDEDAAAEDMALLGNWLAGPGARPTPADRERWAKTAASSQAGPQHYAAG